MAYLFGRDFFRPPAAAGTAEVSPASLDEVERSRWSDVLERFSIVQLPAPSPAETSASGGTGRGDALYWSLWNSCTDLEKLVLIHVAEEGFGNPRQTQTIESLLRRRLLLLDPDLEPFHEDFRRFIREAYDRQIVSEWERPAGRIGWTQARWLLTAVVVAMALFLVGTQRQALTPLVSFVSALAGAFSAILKLVAEAAPKQRASA